MGPSDFDERFDDLAAIAYRVGYRMLGDRGDAEEVAQEAMARAYARWRTVAGHAEPWVARVATNLAISRWRRRRPTVPIGDTHGPPSADPSAAALDRHRLAEALRALPRRQRQVVVLRYLADMPERAVADALGTSVGSVKLRLAVDVPLRDPQTGLDLAPTACATLDGETALQLVRARRVVGDPSGDIGRMARARAVLTAAVAQFGGASEDPRELDRVVGLLADHAAVDEDLSLQVLIDLARAADLDPARLRAPDLPLIAVTTPDGAELLRLGPGADAILQDFGARGATIGDAVDASPAAPPGGTAPVVGIRPC